MKKEKYKIVKSLSGNTIIDLPIFLEEKIDVMGVMSTFDGEMEQMEQYTNFTYTGRTYFLTIFNTTNVTKLKILSEAEFKINWGDGTVSGLTMPSIGGNNSPSITHNYSPSLTGVTVEVTINTPWRKNKVKRFIKLPIHGVFGWPVDFGSLTFEIPYNENNVTVNQEYLVDYKKSTGTTNPSKISFIAAGKSRLNEFKIYGTGSTYSISTSTGIDDIGNFIKYEIDGLTYLDYINGWTRITGTTSGTTVYPYVNEEFYNGMVSRNEVLIGFIDEPQIYSDVFIERGKQSVIERNLRLGEIDNMGELGIYGGGYFNVKKQ